MILTKQLLVIISVIVAILLQSFMISADSTELHELTVDHSSEQTHHVHVGYVTDSTTFEVDADVVQDCHHTGHSSSVHLSWAVPADVMSQQRFDAHDLFAPPNFSLQDVVEKPLRPPIV